MSKKLLSTLGKPLFYALLFSFIGLVFLLSIVGRVAKTLPHLLYQRVKAFKFPHIKTPQKFFRIPSRLKLPQLAIGLPKFPLKIRFNQKAITLTAITALILFSFWFFFFRGLPSPQELITRDQNISTKIYDRNGVLLYKIYKDQNRTLVALADIPQHVRYATLAAEDAEFYNHPGFSLRGILRAMFRNATRGELTGGSTITQQLVKNALLSPEKTLSRKVKEIILSLETEVIFSKDQILEMYLNEVAYGGTAYGIEEASEQYFGKSVGDLTLAQAALLAGLPKSPTKYSPFGANPESAKERQKDVLHLMKTNGFINQEDYEEALDEELVFNQNRKEIKAPHFVMYVKQLLVEKYGEEALYKGGLEVTTTLDWNIQELAETAISQEMKKLTALHVTNAATLILDPQNGEILAMVGSKDYFDIKNDGNVNVITSLRQPGSSIKVVNYAYALSHGYTPASIIADSPVSFAVAGQPLYAPKNYDDKYRGNISLRSALAESRNIPAVKVLASYGVDKMITLGEKMGITTWGDRSRFGLSLTLGGGETKLIDLATVFATIANSGQKPELIAISRITNYKGKLLESSEPKVKEVLDPRVAFVLTDILRDNVARSPAFGSHSALVVPQHPEIAVKTGTSNDLRDNLTLGYNQDYLVAVWVGNNDNSPMSRIASGITGAAPIWNKIMTALVKDQESEAWTIPAGVNKLSICSLTGTLPCQGCPTISEWFLEETAPKMACSSKSVEKIIKDKKQNEVGQILPEAASVVN